MDKQGHLFVKYHKYEKLHLNISVCLLSSVAVYCYNIKICKLTVIIIKELKTGKDTKDKTLRVLHIGQWYSLPL